jgi:hypothetical protein
MAHEARACNSTYEYNGCTQTYCEIYQIDIDTIIGLLGAPSLNEARRLLCTVARLRCEYCEAGEPFSDATAMGDSLLRYVRGEGVFGVGLYSCWIPCFASIETLPHRASPLETLPHRASPLFFRCFASGTLLLRNNEKI